MTLLLALFVGWPAQQAVAASALDEQFRRYMIDVCGVLVIPPEWDAARLLTVCPDFFAGGGAAAGTNNISVNTGTGNAASRSSARSKAFRGRLDEEEDKPKRGASADGGSWGLFVAPQYGEGERPETERENGFDAKLKGLAVGLDYRFSEQFVWGFAAGHTRDDATFLNAAGFLKTKFNTVTTYGTWLPMDGLAIDGYLTYGKIDLDSQREVVAGSLISGTARGTTTGQQMMAGFSVSYQSEIAGIGLSPFINVDGNNTKFKGYEETGNTRLELRFADRDTLSVTSSVGMQVSKSMGFDWGSLSPSLRLAAVHEYKNDAKRISNELVITRGTGFTVETDEPDRDYLSAILGLVAGLNDGTQLFINYEKRAKDELLDSWAVSAGVLLEF